jgi:hypothetical protein
MRAVARLLSASISGSSLGAGGCQSEGRALGFLKAKISSIQTDGIALAERIIKGTLSIDDVYSELTSEGSEA